LDKILFTGSLGSSIEPHTENSVTEEDFSRHQSLMTAFHSRYIGRNEACKRWAAMLRKLDVEMIVPQFGARITGKEMVEKFCHWVRARKQLLMTLQTSCLDSLCRLSKIALENLV